MLQHYFHSSHNLCSKRQNLRSFRLSSKSNNQKSSNNNINSPNHICLSNGNAVEIYKVSADSVNLCIRKQFMCNIVKVEVIPSLHHDSDYIFVLDDLGRYAFWRPGEGMRQVSNVIMEENTKQRYYREEMSPQEEEHFSGSAFKFDVKDTVGHIFFTIQNNLSILKLSVKSKQGLRIENIRKYQIPYTRFRYVNCLKPFNPTKDTSQLIIGIVQQIQQKTILKFHTLNISQQSTLIDEQSLSFKLEKVNILQFSSGENDEIIVLTYDEISLYRYKQMGHLCNYRTKGNYGSACYVPAEEKGMGRSQAVYIHLGFEVIVFTKSKLRNYGGLKLDNKLLLQNRGITESMYLGINTNGQVIIGFVSTFNQVYFVVLRDQKWNLLRKIDSLSSIFSITEVPSTQPNCPLVVVHSSSQSCSEASLVQVTTPTVLECQQCVQGRVIESIYSVGEGQSLVVSHSGESSLLAWSKEDRRWVERCWLGEENKQEVLACQGRYVVMRSGIYKCQFIQNQQQLSPPTVLIKQSNILSTSCNDSYIGYYTSQGTYKFFQIKTQSITRIRKNCIQQYLWHMIPDYNVLVSAAYNQLGSLRILAVDNVGRKVYLQSKQQLVSSIETICYFNNNTVSGLNKSNMQAQDVNNNNNDQSLSVDVIVGFHNGQVEVYSLEKNRTVAKFIIGDEMVRVATYRRGHVVVYTSRRQFILSREVDSNSNKIEYKLHQVQFTNNDSQSSITQLLYLPKFNNFLLSITTPSTHSTVLQLRTLKLSPSLSDQQLSLQLSSSLSLKTLFKAETNDIIPYTEIYNSQYLFIAVSENIFKYSLKTMTLIKQQLHLIKQVIAINSLSSGIVVVGVDFMQSGSIYIFDYQDLSIKSTYNMGPGAKPSSLQTFSQQQADKFLIRHQTFVTIFELQPNGYITPIKSINTKTQGSTIQLNQHYNKILLTDPYRYLSVWDYDLEEKNILPVSKYFGSYMINDTTWLDGTVVTGDRGGNIALLEFNLNNSNDLHKMTMTKVGEISVGEEVFTLTRSQQHILSSKQQFESHNKLTAHNPQFSTVHYGTSRGTMGSIKTITQQQFKLLKQIQLDCIKYIDLKQHFSYQQWRRRLPQNDKLIDGGLIKYYLQQFRSKINSSQEQFYSQISMFYKGIVERT